MYMSACMVYGFRTRYLDITITSVVLKAISDAVYFKEVIINKTSYIKIYFMIDRKLLPLQSLPHM